MKVGDLVKADPQHILGDHVQRAESVRLLNNGLIVSAAPVHDVQSVEVLWPSGRLYWVPANFVIGIHNESR